MMMNNVQSNPASLPEAIARIRELEAQLEKAHTAAVRAVIGMIQIEGAGFVYNAANDYGSINATIFTGKGNPAELFCGEEIQGVYRDGVRGTGRYRLSNAIVPVIMAQLGRAEVAQQRLTAIARPDNRPQDLVERAHLFAKAAHEAVQQLRKYTGEPYIVHPIEVAGIVRSVPHSDAMIAAALLHDTVEDTEVTIADIEREFGAEVAVMVGWLTDVSRPEDGNRAVRKAIDRLHTAEAPAEVKTIKLADLISNSKSILAHDPVFARVYLREKAALLEVLREGDGLLWNQANQLLQEGLRAIGENE